MNWQILISLNSTLKALQRFLIVFSICITCTVGIIWACADSGEDDYSVFAPEYFVDNQYSPFFYTTSEVYYKQSYGQPSNSQYNSIIVNEWYEYFGHKLGREELQYLLLKASDTAIDSVALFKANVITTAKPDSSFNNVSKIQRAKFFNYLKLAKACEKFSVYPDNAWYDTVKRQHSQKILEADILKSFQQENDPFIKERLWFQQVRYYYFDEDTSANINAVKVFERYKNDFPKNNTYYRSMGYVAGYYYSRKNYATANYMYSLCFAFSSSQKIPAYWSFHPQNEKDWNETLKLAKTPEEKINLWQMLGIWYDEGRAVQAIYNISPRSDKLDLLLSRIINEHEGGGGEYMSDRLDSAINNNKTIDKSIIESIALKNNTAKPYFWNLAAGYLNFLDSDYVAASKFYTLAKKQLPIDNTMIMAQSKLLDILLTVKKLTNITKTDEEKLIEPLNWLADLQEDKKVIANLRFRDALRSCASDIAQHYYKQDDLLKEVCFDDSTSFYTDGKRVQALVELLNKPNKTPFESVMLRYYPHTLYQLYYHQALELAYKDRTEQAIAILKKKNVKEIVLDANPFNSRLNDCHDCDAAAPQKQKFTPLSFLQTLQSIKNEIKTGKNIYQNNYLIASAYYNITYYGNDRSFYEADMIGGFGSRTYDENGNEEIEDMLVNMDKAVKYYLIAKSNATTNEQKARCTFMLSKCVLNGYYSDPHFIANNAQDTTDYYHIFFRELKDKYAKTAYYKDVLRDCGYFRDFISKKNTN